MRIENEKISLEVGERGGSMVSLFDKERGEELLYQPHPDSWQGQDIIIFPVVARLMDQSYTYEGETYSLKNHGLLRYMDARLERGSETCLRACFSSDKETRTRYPFDFEFCLTYALKGNGVSLSYRIVNRSYAPMPFMLGAHPAFRLPGMKREEEFDISGNTVEIKNGGQATILLQDPSFSFMTGEKERISSRLPLSRDLFRRINTVILDAESFEDVALEKKDGSALIIHKHDAPYVALWSDMKFGDYVCIEPWFGLPDTIGSSKEISKKPGINILSVGCEFAYGYEIEIK